MTLSWDNTNFNNEYAGSQQFQFKGKMYIENTGIDKDLNIIVIGCEEKKAKVVNFLVPSDHIKLFAE